MIKAELYAQCLWILTIFLSRSTTENQWNAINLASLLPYKMAADFYSRDIFMTKYGATPSNLTRLYVRWMALCNILCHENWLPNSKGSLSTEIPVSPIEKVILKLWRCFRPQKLQENEALTKAKRSPYR